MSIKGIPKVSSYNTKYYNRQWEISVSLDTGKTVYLSASDPTKQADLKCVFTIPSGMQIPLYGDVTVYNLSKNSIAEIMKSGTGLTVKAGYYGSGVKGEYGTIWNDFGIMQCLTEKINGVDFALTIHSSNAKYLIEKFIAEKYVEANTETLRDHAERSLTSGKFKVAAKTSALQAELVSRGKITYDTGYNVVREYARNTNQLFGVDPKTGEVIWMKDSAVDTVPIKVGKEYGLLSQITKLQKGITYRCLLDPNIRWLSKLEVIKGTYVKEFYRTINNVPAELKDTEQQYYTTSLVTHVGDTRGNDWYSEVKGEVDPSNAISPLNKK